MLVDEKQRINISLWICLRLEVGLTFIYLKNITTVATCIVCRSKFSHYIAALIWKMIVSSYFLAPIFLCKKNHP